MKALTRLLTITTLLIAGGITYGSSQGSGSGFILMDDRSGLLLPMDLSTSPSLPTATPTTAELQPSIVMTTPLSTSASSSPQAIASLQPTNVVIPLEPTSTSQLTTRATTSPPQSTDELRLTTSASPLQPASITVTSQLTTTSTTAVPQPTSAAGTPFSILPTTTTTVSPETTPTRPIFASSVSTLLSVSSSPAPSAPPTNPPDTTESSFIAVLEDALGGPLGVAGAAVGVALVAILLVIVCCICCCCMYKTIKKVRRRKKTRLHLDTQGMSFENQGARNGALGTSYQYKGDNSLHELHHYDMIGEADGGAYLFNESALDPDMEFPVRDVGEPSQMMPSQLSLANTEIFQKGTLPELSPMTYSLTANYPIPGEDASGLYINTLPTSTLSLKQPTPFGLSLQNEESKSNQGSRLSIHGSRPSIHGSRPSIHGSRPSIHGSRPSVHESRPSIYSSRTSSIPGGLGSRPTLHNSGTSESLLLGRFDKDDEPSTIFSNRLSSPNLLPSNSDTMEVPTRDSSPLPHLLASSHPLGHNKRDFASLTCIVNPNTSPPATPTPEPLEEKQDNSLLARTRSPTHKKPKMDLTSLTSVPIPEEDENLKVKKEESPATKKGRSKAMSRLEKLTSLDYIRQSFRIKKKKVSFQNVKTPESTPTPSKKTSLKKQTTPPPSTTSNGKTSNGKTSNGGSAQPSNSPSKESPQRRISTTSSDLFSPNEDSYLRMQQQLAAQGYVDHMMPMPHMAGYGQLSQPNYYLPQYPYPQLSQQYYPQLSQGYPGPFASPYHHMHANPYMGLRPGEAPSHRDPPISRHREVITPDFSDITSPDHERYRGGQTPSPDPERDALHPRDVSSPEHEHYRETGVHSPHPSDIQGSEYSYDLRPNSPRSYDGDDTPQARHREREVLQEQFHRGNSHRPLSPPSKQGEHHLGMHPQVSPAHYTPYFNQDVSRYGLGYGREAEQEGHYPPQQGRRGSGAGFVDGQVGRRVSGGSIPEREQGWRSNSHTPEKRLSKSSVDASTPFYHHHSISVDEPLHQHTSPNHRHSNTSTAERRHSTYSDTSTSERRHSTYSDTSMQFHAEPSSGHTRKPHVSWSSDVRDHPNISNHHS